MSIFPLGYWRIFVRKTVLEFEERKLLSLRKKNIIVLNVRRFLQNPN